MFRVVKCISTLIVYCDIISGYAHKQLSCTKPLPNVICEICPSEIVFCANTLYFNWPNLFIQKKKR